MSVTIEMPGSAPGSYMPETQRILYAGSPVAPIWRKMTQGSPARPSPFASGRQVLLFRMRAWSTCTPPSSRMPRGPGFRTPPALIRERPPAPVLTSTIRFRQFIDGSLSLVSVDLT